MIASSHDITSNDKRDTEILAFCMHKKSAWRLSPNLVRDTCWQYYSRITVYPDGSICPRTVSVHKLAVRMPGWYRPKASVNYQCDVSFDMHVPLGVELLSLAGYTSWNRDLLMSDSVALRSFALRAVFLYAPIVPGVSLACPPILGFMGWYEMSIRVCSLNWDTGLISGYRQSCHCMKLCRLVRRWTCDSVHVEAAVDCVSCRCPDDSSDPNSASLGWYGDTLTSTPVLVSLHFHISPDVRLSLVCNSLLYFPPSRAVSLCLLNCQSLRLVPGNLCPFRRHLEDYLKPQFQYRRCAAVLLPSVNFFMGLSLAAYGV